MRRWGVLVGALGLLGLAPIVGSDAVAKAPGTLPSVASGARPGPAVLYADPPKAPQLENRDPRFKAAPILVMGQEAYADGEYLYQDWIYDDNGADTGADDAGGSDTAGDVAYPAEPKRYGGNAADIVELRVAPGPSDVKYRFTMNTLLVPDSTIITLALDLPGNATNGITASHGLSGLHADQVVTAWGTGAEVETWKASAAGGSAMKQPVAVKTDLEANQITVTVPRSLSNPTGKVNAALAAGVRDAAMGDYLQTSANPVTPPSPAYDLGLTFDESPAGITPPDSKQAAHLENNEIPTHAIDFGALAARVNTTSVPKFGTMGRIYPSRLKFGVGEGKDYDDTPEIHGQLQPMSIYVPKSYDASRPAPLVLDLHSLGEHHWQYNGSLGVEQISGETRGAIVITCECRGEDGWYLNEAEYDVFEMWNDVARHFNLDPNRAAITGYSMGGYATYRLGGLYPDLFSKALSIVGPPTAGIWLPPTPVGDDETLSNIWLDNFRDLPILNAAAGPDELVPVAGTRAQNLGAPEWGIRGFDQLGYRYRYNLYPTAEHLTIGVLKYDLPYQDEWFGDVVVDRNPSHVTFRYLPASDDAALGLVHDHAYWVSAVKVAGNEELRSGLVDAVSSAFGRGDPPVSDQLQGAGQGPLPYASFERTWGKAPTIAATNQLALQLTDVSQVTIDLARARLHLAGLILKVKTNVPVTVRLVDGRTVEDRTFSP